MPEIDLGPRGRLHYIDTDQSGKAVVLLHGLGADGSSWGLQIPALFELGFRVLAPDAPGFGQSTFIGDPPGISQTADLYAEWFACLNLRKPHLVGISMGGVIALQLALDRPQLVDRLVLVNTFARFQIRPQTWLYYLKRFLLVSYAGPKAQAQSVAKRIFPDPEDIDYRNELVRQILQADPRAYRNAMVSMSRFNVLHRLPSINLPTLVVTGGRDTTVPERMQASMAKRIPAARQVVITTAGHALTIDEPEQFNNLLMNFLRIEAR